MAERSILTGWVLLLPNDRSFLRLLAALLAAIAFQALTFVASPYRRYEDNVLSGVAVLLLVLIYVMSIVIKLFEDFSNAPFSLAGTDLARQVLGFESTGGFVALLIAFTAVLLIVMLVAAGITIKAEVFRVRVCVTRAGIATASSSGRGRGASSLSSCVACARSRKVTSRCRPHMLTLPRACATWARRRRPRSSTPSSHARTES